MTSNIYMSFLTYMAEPGTVDTEQVASPQEATGETPSSRVNREQADQAEAQQKEKWSSLMDSIEKSRDTQGAYFAKVGKKGMRGHDSRALIFTEPYSDEYFNNIYIALTQDGPKGIIFHQGTEDAEQKEFSERIADLADFPTDLDYSNYRSPTGIRGEGKQYYANLNGIIQYIGEKSYGDSDETDFGGEKRTLAQKRTLVNVTNPDIITDVIKKSIEKSESPHKARLERATQSTALAQNLLATVGSLPPRA